MIEQPHISESLHYYMTKRAFNNFNMLLFNSFHAFLSETTITKNNNDLERFDFDGFLHHQEKEDQAFFK
jgi:predicted carbohydrate-binding protein with CBM5 and CBM33 domain